MIKVSYVTLTLLEASASLPILKLQCRHVPRQAKRVVLALDDTSDLIETPPHHKPIGHLPLYRLFHRTNRTILSLV